MKEASARLKGVIVPMVTPFDACGDVDETALRRLTRWLVARGVHGVYPGSGCGEVWKLTVPERQRLIDTVVAEAGGKAMVMPGTGGGSTEEAILMTRYARDKGCDAVVIWPPYFMGDAYSDAAIFDHFRTIARAVEIPIVVYDSPEITGYPLSPALVVRLAELETVVGIKDSTGSMDKFVREFSQVAESIAVLQGWDTLFLAALAIGSPGAVLSSANVCPELLVGLYEDFHAGDLAAARRKHTQLVSLVSTQPWAADQFQSMKVCLNMRGVDVGAIRKPWFSVPFTAAQNEELRCTLRALELID